MPKYDLNVALDDVNMVYRDIVDIADDILHDLFEPIDNLVNSMQEDINAYSVEELNSYAYRLQLRAYTLSETKDKAALKATVAEALRKEKYAKEFTGADGTVNTKENKAVLASSEQIAVEALYDLTANLVKTKQDQLHRLIDTLKSIVISRNQEAKLNISTGD